MASPRTAAMNSRRSPAATRTAVLAGVALLALAVNNIVSPGLSAFVLGASQLPRVAQRSTVPSRALSDAERAAVLRLPDKKEAPEEKEDVKILGSAGASVEMSATQRAALRLNSEKDQADFMKDMNEKKFMEEAIMQEQAISDGSAMGSFGMFFYYACAAAVMWTWIMNIQRIWMLGHPEPPQF